MITNRTNQPYTYTPELIALVPTLLRFVTVSTNTTYEISHIDREYIRLYYVRTDFRIEGLTYDTTTRAVFNRIRIQFMKYQESIKPDITMFQSKNKLEGVKFLPDPDYEKVDIIAEWTKVFGRTR